MGKIMDIDTAKTKIIKHNAKKIQDKVEKEIHYKAEQEKLIDEIQALQPRIEQILTIGNLCIENGINLRPGMFRKSCKYKNDCFETDGIHHQLGFYPNHYQGHPHYKCSHYEYIGYDMGGACGNINFITNGDTVASTPDHSGFEIKGTSEPIVKHMKRFLRDFPKFEEAFENFIEKL